MEGFRFHEHIIWGATGRMLRNFLDVAVAAAGPPAAEARPRERMPPPRAPCRSRDTAATRHASDPRPSR